MDQHASTHSNSVSAFIPIEVHATAAGQIIVFCATVRQRDVYNPCDMPLDAKKTSRIRVFDELQSRQDYSAKRRMLLGIYDYDSVEPSYFVLTLQPQQI
jgi:hypothetical protein